MDHDGHPFSIHYRTSSSRVGLADSGKPVYFDCSGYRHRKPLRLLLVPGEPVAYCEICASWRKLYNALVDQVQVYRSCLHSAITVWHSNSHTLSFGCTLQLLSPWIQENRIYWALHRYRRTHALHRLALLTQQQKWGSIFGPDGKPDKEVLLR